MIKKGDGSLKLPNIIRRTTNTNNF